MSETFDITYLSLGAGVQSSAMLVAAALGTHGVPRPDFAVFADTGDEPSWVYEYLGTLTTWAGARGIEVVVTQAIEGMSLSDHIRQQMATTRSHYVSTPVYTAGDGRESMLRRQCTREWKLAPIKKAVRGRLGLKKGERAAGRYRVRALIGISTDEAQRMKPSRDSWVENTYPLIDANLSRADCIRIVEETGLPRPRKSACIHCPYHDDRTWAALKIHAPDEFEQACRFDDDIRHATSGQDVFIHRSLQPLREIDFIARLNGGAGQLQLFEDPHGLGMGDECEGMCGV